MNITVKEKRNKRWVTLKPCEMHLVKTEYMGKCTLYAGLWDIQSSDNATHDKFCKLAYKERIFMFGNTGTRTEDDIPYTFNDGLNSRSWLIELISLIKTCKEYGIHMQIELDKKFIDEYDLYLEEPRSISMFDGKSLDKEQKDILYNTYIATIYVTAASIQSENPDINIIDEHIICKQKKKFTIENTLRPLWDSKERLIVEFSI